ncbi:MAG: hypothetical protein sL5_08480 [Candidatus Mesenet longicola]|uniref:RDD domain-containing protein n=1 Tax=Candidatus Mesenet longicola TaxID=1892558 RepID=A0A8J3MPF3_9RICK|nr:MAG: hypothetical protein sGL2_09090 [Candidatus Mesenet longicola]GHM59855.1 MAG: hypothetical protein sL5_08480 [Candidatus Mesenet longicola]
MSNIYLEPAGLIRRFIAFLSDMVLPAALLFVLVLFPILALIGVLFLIFFHLINENETISKIGEIIELYLHSNLYIIQEMADIVTLILSLLLPLLYYAYCRNATLGQKAMDVYVMRLDQVKIEKSFAFKRFLIWSLPQFIMMWIIVPVAGYFFGQLTLSTIPSIFFIAWYIIPPIFSDKNQMIHDMLCKTVVVKGKFKRS